MILVTLGTQDKPFTRLLDAIQREIENGNIKTKVFVQAGNTRFKSEKMVIIDLISPADFEKLVSECDLLITHGGVGSIMTGIKHHKKIIGVARLMEYGEHTNNHQLQILENFSEAGYIIHLKDLNRLGETLKNVKNFKPKKYISKSTMIEMVSKLIDEN